MRILFAAVLISLSATALIAADSGKAVPIFDAKTFKGWDGDTNKTWRVEDGAFVGGVQIRSERTKNRANEMSGYQVDMGDPEWWGCLYDESRRNKVMAKSDIKEVNKVLKRGDWNEYVIRAEGKRIRAWINGLPTVDYTEADDAIPQFGKIGLQVHGGGKTEAWYKDITLEELP